MKVEKLHSGSYRIRKQINGKRRSFTFSHRPSEAEIIAAIAERDFSAEKGSFLFYGRNYIDSKSNVLSPTTIREYNKILDNVLPEDFTHMDLSEIEQKDIQLVINNYAADHAPKTVRNIHGFITAVLKQFRPNMQINTTLPQKREKDLYTPSEDDIKRILDASKDDPLYHVPFQLGVMGLRRSEVCALELSDINGNLLTIDKALVEDKDKNWVIKSTKTVAGTRKIFIPDSLVSEIRTNGRIYDGHPGKLRVALRRYQDKLGIPHFRFHDLRHFFASYAHSQGISDADIMASGGWKSDYTMKKIYRHEMNAIESQKKIFKNLL